MPYIRNFLFILSLLELDEFFLHIGLKERIKLLVLNTCKPWLTGVIYQSVFTRCHAAHSFYITSDSTGMGKEFLLWKSEGKEIAMQKKKIVM